MSTLRAAFDAERAWLRDADDQRAVLDRIAGYRESMAYARRVGNAQAHDVAEHLVELAEDRLMALKVAATPSNKPTPAPALPKAVAPPPPEPPARPPAPSPRVDDSDIVRQLQAALAASQEAERRAARDRDAAQRVAREAGAERDSALASQNRASDCVSVARVAPPVGTPVSDARRLSPHTTVPTTSPSHAPEVPYSATTSPRPTAAGTASPPPSSRPAHPARPDARAPSPKAATPRVPQPAAVAAPTPAPPRSPSRTSPADAGLPALTGADLAAFRRGAGLTQVAAAQRLGVTQGTISKAEGNARAALGPALADALRRAAA